MKRAMTCITCPMGCSLEVEYEGAKVLLVKGNQCKMGELYSRQEICSPVRTLTTTIQISGTAVTRLPVKTSKPVERDKLVDISVKLSGIKVYAPIKAGTVIISDICGTGADIVATANMN